MKLCTPVIACLMLPFSGRSQVNSNTVTPDTLLSEYTIPVFSTGGDDAESEPDQQDASVLLLSSKDVFVQYASFQFGASRYRLRGYPAGNQEVMVNGIDMNSPETGFSSWSSWGGLNDVTRFSEVRTGISPSRYLFAGPNGYVNIDSRASSFKKNTRVTLTAANRIYQGRFMLTHSTGMSARGWAFTLSASGRYGEETNRPGTYFRACSFYTGADRRINHRHLLSITAFVAPLEQGRAASNVAEAYLLAGDNAYNSAWGYQDGRVRSSNVSKSIRPVFMVSHVNDVNKDVKLTSSLMLSAGRNGISGIGSYHAPNHKPDYYKNFPSFYLMTGDSSGAFQALEDWSDPAFRQINWDRLIAMNRANLYTNPQLLGQGINTSETRARYIVEERVERNRQLAMNSVLNARRGRLFLSAGISALAYDSRKFKEVVDLLGASFWLDVDQFAENLGVEESIIQNDLDNPDKKVREGDRFGYDYSIRLLRATTWTQAEYEFRKLDLYAAASFQSSAVQRTGHVANGKFPYSSKGKGEMRTFQGGGLKSGFTWKLTGRHYITGNYHWQSRMPAPTDIYISPRVRQDMAPDLRNERITSLDANYYARFPAFRMRLGIYHTVFSDRMWLRSYWDDVRNAMVNLLMDRVSQVHRGIEFGIDRSFSVHQVQCALGLGRWVYSGRPRLQGWQENNSVSLFTDKTVYLDGFRTGGSPQLAAGAGYRINGRRYWFAGVNLNYLDQIYAEVSPVKRTGNVTGKYNEDEMYLVESLLMQERLPAYFVANAVAGKLWRLKKRRTLNLMLSFNNLLNKRDIRVSGFEQLRFDPVYPEMFPAKYSYMNGLTFMLNSSYTF
jgi:hypothetical protein